MKNQTRRVEQEAANGYRRGAVILGMIARRQGATIDELVRASLWTKNSIYSFISQARKFRRIVSFHDHEDKLRYIIK